MKRGTAIAVSAVVPGIAAGLLYYAIIGKSKPGGLSVSSQWAGIVGVAGAAAGLLVSKSCR